MLGRKRRSDRPWRHRPLLASAIAGVEGASVRVAALAARAGTWSDAGLGGPRNTRTCWSRRWHRRLDRPRAPGHTRTLFVLLVRVLEQAAPAGPAPDHRLAGPRLGLRHRRRSEVVAIVAAAADLEPIAHAQLVGHRQTARQGPAALEAKLAVTERLGPHIAQHRRATCGRSHASEQDDEASAAEHERCLQHDLLYVGRVATANRKFGWTRARGPSAAARNGPLEY